MPPAPGVRNIPWTQWRSKEGLWGPRAPGGVTRGQQFFD